MLTFLPSWKGTVAIVLAILAELFLPALIGPPPTHYTGMVELIVATCGFLLCCTAAVAAIFSKKFPDKLCGIAAIGLTLFTAYLFSS